MPIQSLADNLSVEPSFWDVNLLPRFLVSEPRQPAYRPDGECAGLAYGPNFSGIE